MDPAFNQLHLYVCIMIELRNYAATDKVLSVFTLCKEMLKNKVKDFPVAKDVIYKYASIKTPQDFPILLTKTNYTDKFVNDVNDILTEIFLQETPEELVNSFYKLTDLTINI